MRQYFTVSLLPASYKYIFYKPAFKARKYIGVQVVNKACILHLLDPGGKYKQWRIGYEEELCIRKVFLLYFILHPFVECPPGTETLRKTLPIVGRTLLQRNIRRQFIHIIIERAVPCFNITMWQTLCECFYNIGKQIVGRLVYQYDLFFGHAYLSMIQFSSTSISILVRRKQSSASAGVFTMGSFSLKDVLSKIGIPVFCLKASMSA